MDTTRKRKTLHSDAPYLPSFSFNGDDKLDDEYIRHGKKEKKFRVSHKSDDEPIFPQKYSLIFVFILIAASFIFVKYADSRLPKMIKLDEAEANPNSFIGDRAWKDLEVLTSYGPRVAGSYENDKVTVKHLLTALNEISKEKLEIYKLEFEVQRPSGAFDLKFLNDIFTNSYSGIPNVVAKLDTERNNHFSDSILLNCHFDSVPSSPGASDDMISCVTMLEILRVLSRQPIPLKNRIIFLFNGAEENFLPGSHGFIAGKEKGSDSVGHRWNANVRALINMEACGAGGREILFQTGPGNGWLVEAYAKSAKYPYGTAMGEEIFQRGLIPSDTDFRVFRDYLKVPGLDLAFVKNGWVYHTKFDSIENIPEGSLQNIGTNMLALTQTLGNLDFSTIELTDNKMVFTDIFGFYMMVYSEKTGIIINVIVSLLTLFLIIRDVNGDILQIFSNVLTTLIAWTCGILGAVLVGVVLNLLNYPMPFYSYPYFVYLLFGIPAIVTQVGVYVKLMKGVEDQTWMAAKVTLSIMTLIITFYTRLAFILTINVLFGVLGWCISRYIFKDCQRRMLLYLLVGEFFPLSISFYYSTSAIDVFVPIMGRSGTEANPNLFLAAYTAFSLSIPGLSGLIPIFVFFKKTFFKTTALLYLFVIAFLVLGIGKIPYREKTPMRLHVVEVDRNWFGSDLKTVTKSEAGFWFFNLDPNTALFFPKLQENIPEISKIQEIDNMKCADLYCGLPLFFPITKLVRTSQWIPKTERLPALLRSRVNMEITEDQFLSPSRRRLTFSFSGPDHLSIVLCPGPNYDLVKWSLSPHGVNVPQAHVFWKGRPTYFIKHGRGIEFERLEITCDFERKGKDEGNGEENQVVDINLSSFSIHGDDMRTQNLDAFVKRLPEWTYTMAWGSVTNLYTVK